MKPKLTIAEDGTKTWKLNGLLHREDGPAIIWANGYKSWFINGIHYSEQKFLSYILPNSIYISTYKPT